MDINFHKVSFSLDFFKALPAAPFIAKPVAFAHTTNSSSVTNHPSRLDTMQRAGLKLAAAAGVGWVVGFDIGYYFMKDVQTVFSGCTSEKVTTTEGNGKIIVEKEAMRLGSHRLPADVPLLPKKE